jgi:enterochelin esterase family protein
MKPLSIVVMLCALALASASDVFAQGKPIGAEEGCLATCRAARNNPKPEFISPEVSPDGRVTVRVYAPKSDSIGISGLEPLNKNGESEIVLAKKGEDGIWTYVSPARPPGTYAYFVRIDGVVDALDPSNLYVVNSRLGMRNIVEIGGGEDFARYDPKIPHGAVGEVFYRTPGFEFDRRMRVYTPPGYGLKQETLPVLFLLPGGGQSEEAWGKLGRANFILDKLIAEGRAKRMLAVMIDGYVDDFRRGSSADFDPTTDDIQKGVIPYIESNYMVSKDPKNRAIAGLSRGATQTRTIALKHPGVFNYVGMFSISRTLIGGVRKETEGMKTEADWQALRDVVNKYKYFYWTVGTEDGGYNESKAVWELYREHNINVATEARSGNHEYLVWRPALRDFAMKLF